MCSLLVPQLYSAQATLPEKTVNKSWTSFQQRINAIKSHHCTLSNGKRHLYTQTHTHAHTPKCIYSHITVVCPVDIHCANPCKSIYPKMLSLRTSSNWKSHSGNNFAVWVVFGWFGCFWVVTQCYSATVLCRQQPLSVPGSAANATSCVVGIKNAINAHTQYSPHRRDKYRSSGNFMPLCVYLYTVYIPFSNFTFHPFAFDADSDVSSDADDDVNACDDVDFFSIFRSEPVMSARPCLILYAI